MSGERTSRSLRVRLRKPPVPNFRYRGNVMTLEKTKAAERVLATSKGRPKETEWTDDKVKDNAVKEVLERGGAVDDPLWLLGFYKIQFGQYQSQTFCWLMENDPGWCAVIALSPDSERHSNQAIADSKANFKKYMKMFSETHELMLLKQEHDRKQEARRRRAPPNRRAQATCPVNAPESTKTEGESSPDRDITDEQLLAAVEVLESVEQAEQATTSTRKRALPQDGDRKEYLLTEGWKQSLPRADHQWVSHALFKESSKGKAEVDSSKINKLWFYPPEPKFLHGQPPKPSLYYARRLLMWMPRKLWGFKFVCTHKECDSQELNSAGIYPHVRQVVDIDGYYNLAGEYLECRRCRRKVISWSKPMLDQLDTGHRLQFPIVLTYKLACDMTIVRMMRDRTLGNGPFQMIRKVKEAHTGAWLRKTALYVNAVNDFVKASERGLITRPQCESPPPMPALPTYQWLLSVYCNDVLERIDEVKASLTSTFGRILKIDSTRKITRKLAGPSKGTAFWATNVGNENGQVLMSVMTASEGVHLQKMMTGIVDRYAAAGEPTPELLYVDRDCCGARCKYFKEWPDMPVRLDVWHFMRRLARGCTTDLHQLYPFFLRRLSACIFIWSADDVDLLVRAKRAELAEQNITCPADDDVFKRIGRKEMARHCRRTTRGTDETKKLIKELITALDGEEGKDTLGVPLFNYGMIWEIWDTQERHVACLQDPPDVQLYTKTGEMVKGGVTLPVYKCGRGSTSLESFHLHMNRFIPGTSANDVHLQAYLMEGVHRWNCDRAMAAISAKGPTHASYGSYYEMDLNRMTEQLFGEKINPTLVVPRKYTGELFGMEYLIRQNNEDPLQPKIEELVLDPDEAEGDDDGEDVGSREVEDLEDPTQPPAWEPARPAATRQSVRASTKRPAPSETVPSKSPVKRRTTVSTSTGSRAPATLSRAPDSPPPFASVTTTTSRAPATLSRAPDSPPASVTEPGTTSATSMAPATLPRPPASPIKVEEEQDEVTFDIGPVQEGSDEEYAGPKNILGYDRVEALADYLMQFMEDDCRISTNDANEIVKLWKKLHLHDQTITRPPHHKEKLTKGRFKATGGNVSGGVESTKRSILGNNAAPASWPDANRIMECIFKRLNDYYPHHEKKRGTLAHLRWDNILHAYRNIRTKIVDCAHVKSNTNLQLMDVNQRTLIQWLNQRSKDQERQTLEMGVSVAKPALVTRTPLPVPKEKPQTHVQPQVPNPIHVALRPNKAGQATTKKATPAPLQTFVLTLPFGYNLQSASAENPRNVPPVKDIPRSTLCSRRRREEALKEGKQKTTYKPRKGPTICSKCKQVRDKEQHHHYFGSWYCKRTDPGSFEEWLRAKKMEREERKKQKE